MLASNVKAIVLNNTVYQHVNQSDLIKQLEIPIAKYDGGVHFNLDSGLKSQLNNLGKIIYFKAIGDGQTFIGDIDKNGSFSASSGSSKGHYLYSSSDIGQTNNGDHWFWCKSAYSDTTFSSVKLFAVAVIGGGS